MARIGRPGLSDEQKREVWRRWRDGQSLSEIGRALGKVPGSVHGVVAANGGFVPASRTRSAGVLSLAEREEISRGLAAGDSVRAIAGRLGRAPSAVSREVGRHGGREKYRAAHADESAWDNSRRPKSCLLRQSPALRDTVAGKLEEDWSPRQIAGGLARTFAPEDGMYVSHETVCKSLFIQARGVLKKELVSHLRRRRTMRRSESASTAGQQRGRVRDAVSICERPAEAGDRAVPGHWEGGLITGSENSRIATPVERHSRYVMLVRVGGKDTTSAISALSHQVRYLPDGLMTSLTWDRGTELADHKRFTMATDVKVYVADPKSPWQRGSNENTNGLLRQYFPKGSDLSGYTQADLDAVALKLNTRPRQTLGFETPADRLAAAVASTG
ncbi:IS30 family transposase [Streptomyces vinaceus]